MSFDSFSINKVESSKFDMGYNLQHSEIEIVLINKSHKNLFPIAYEFRTEVVNSVDFWSWTTHDFSRIKENDFLFLGEVDMLDKRTRTLRLRNQNTVKFQYLVVISDSENKPLSSQLEKFLAGLRVLTEAIMMQKKLQLGILSKNHVMSFFGKDAQFTKTINENPQISSLTHVTSRTFKKFKQAHKKNLDPNNRYYFEIEL